ncbi:Uncharacterized protein AArcCO_1761 [Halalkaliarchaeum sp. AArc-CO]|uniref:hypothetical protein n=1 Tax=unclassified Halalkaliarchaeum TaxID=2678344 RepID=UPI00217EC1B5|nr:MULTISPECIES: hypothetical protein [unclassified Halalkaliarchaeum]MDR5671560.1 hypothetical protein [Halalkaliarchaeum sp. AArc-GB]UWG51060.1 Uncharacterized protein AArcCO_1761 [Halalkaliarchaeum sp. AArc-CO]
MRSVTRNAVLLVGVVLVGLLALGALPGYLGSGDPYYLVLEETDDDGTAVDVSDVSERRYPYLTGALASDDLRSDPYQEGPYGLKEHFTHTPFDEVSALAHRVPAAEAADGRVRIETDDRRYYAEVIRE